VSVKGLVFLPDRDGRDEVGNAQGFVRLGASVDDLGPLAERLAVPSRAAAVVNAAAWRSALTLALLTDVWADCGAKVTILTIDGKRSPFSSWVLAARSGAQRGEPVHLVLMEYGGRRCLLGMADEQHGLLLPAVPSDMRCAPERAGWIDRATGAIADPVSYLNERDRAILLARLEALKLSAPEAAAFAADLQTADAPEVEAVRAGDEAALERLAIRMEAVHGLADFEAFSVREEPYAAGDNALLRCLRVQDQPKASAGKMRTYLWRGVPFARTSSELGLTGPAKPCDAVLQEIADELAIMSGSSVKWNQKTAAALERWLDGNHNSDTFLAQARERIEASCALLKENGRQVQSAVTLTWPWDASSGAVRALLKEALGESWLTAAAAPFSDRLTKLTGHQLGDTALQTCCACADGVLLPPLSRQLAACAAETGLEGGLALDVLRFQPQEDGGITASFLLRGEGEILMVRHYGPEEICVLDEAEAPAVAVWPCLPMADWRAYHVFVQGGTEVAALCGGEWKSAEAGDHGGWRCLHVTEYPGCLIILRDGECLGALPNMLPACTVEKQGNVTIGIDLGSSRTAVALAWNGVPRPLEGQELTRLLVSPQEMAEDGFLASLTPASLIPTAAALTGPGETLFTDGYAYRPCTMAGLTDFDARLLRARLKWRSDPDSIRARWILLHQVMLGAALTAALDGAQSVSWRFTIADEMGDEGRDDAMHMFTRLAVQVAEETGLPLSGVAPSVTWAEESAALCACLRAEGLGRESCMAVDLGSASTKTYLWLKGQNRPACSAVVLEGVQDVLLKAFRLNPRWLLEDFADCGNEALLADVLALVDQLNPDLRGARQSDKLSLMLDLLLDTHRIAIGQHLNARLAANQPTRLQAILLETVAASLFTAGLMLAHVGDNATIGHQLPDDVNVCLTGRGAWLLETLTPAMRGSLQHLTHAPLRLNHPVRFITLRPAAKPAQSVAMGVAVTAETGKIADAPQVRTRESFSGLMQRMMHQLCMAFPAHMWLLHEGLYDWQTGVLTQAGSDSIRRAAACCYDDGEDIPASVLAFVRTLRESPILPDSMI